MCGYRRCLRALQFHHIDRSTKTTALYRLINDNRHWHVIEMELKKCLLLCSNCHAEVEDAYDSGYDLVLTDTEHSFVRRTS
jgi:hypothetical protein